MIAADSSSVIAYLEGEQTPDCAAIDLAIVNKTLCLPPPVVSEILSATGANPEIEAVLNAAPMMELSPDFWRRVGRLRRDLLELGLKARLPDAMVAQCCIDADVALITRDRDFRHYAAAGGLKLAP